MTQHNEEIDKALNALLDQLSEAEQAAFLRPRGFSHPNAAMCIWEEILQGENKKARDYLEDVGSGEFRYQVWTYIVPLCLEVWDLFLAIQAELYVYDGARTMSMSTSFDFEYVPFFLAECINWETEQNWCLVPRWEPLVYTFSRENTVFSSEASVQDVSRFNKFMAKSERKLMRTKYRKENPNV